MALNQADFRPWQKDIPIEHLARPNTMSDSEDEQTYQFDDTLEHQTIRGIEAVITDSAE